VTALGPSYRMTPAPLTIGGFKILRDTATRHTYLSRESENSIWDFAVTMHTGREHWG